ncbi:protein phosphatase 1 regulatory subunit 3C-B-like isoform X1 [Lepisosteus oculatus]|uniref:protein phosphatase 1 regulatory subunit 3C-B-like isoform X1 n=1 Tax=Lepisosteus oculatus TaxID=7918 RepID=UPI00073FCA6E|nr:PREDICTED: protein phosphatase 1 regulatory subunit 3C-B-like isoform X1 [Lepisosteus oculatus]
MNCTKVLHVFGGHSVPQPVMPVDLAMRLCLSQSQPLCHLLGVTSLKPLRPCLNPRTSQQLDQHLCRPASPSPSERPATQSSGISGDGTTTKKKRVVFADSKGLSLTAVRFFSEKDEDVAFSELPLVQLRGLGKPVSVAKGEGASGKRWRLKLAFSQPSADYLDFKAQLQQNLVRLENCSVNERLLSGTVKVRNISFEKAVNIRITFDSWRSFCDVPCSYLQQHYGGTDTDTFAFEILLPDDLDPRERLEFCVSYTPGGSRTTLWDNNHGRNFRILIFTNPEPVSLPRQHRRSFTPPPQRRSLWLNPEGKLSKLEPLGSPRAATTDFLFSQFQGWGRLESTSCYW